MLQADRPFGIGGGDAGALARHVVKIFSAERQVVHRRKLIVQIGQEGLSIRCAVDLSRISAVRRAGALKGMYCGENGVPPAAMKAFASAFWLFGTLVSWIFHEFKGDVPLIVEPVVIGAADPLQVVVTPLSLVQRVAAEIEVVVGAVGLVAQAQGVGGDRAGFSGSSNPKRADWSHNPASSEPDWSTVRRYSR